MLSRISLVIALVLTCHDGLAQLQRDPTRPATTSGLPAIGVAGQTDTKRIAVSAIFSRQQQAHAVINGHSLKVGESFDGIEVTDIDKHSVTLVYQDTTHKINLIQHTQEIKSDVSNQF